MKVCEIGRHTLVYGDDGVSVMTYRGDVSVEEMKAILETEELPQVPDVVMLICDMREMGKIAPEARSMGARNPKPAKRYLTAYVGASFAVRVVAGARFAYHRSVTRGRTVRMALDIDSHSLSFEEADGRVFLARNDWQLNRVKIDWPDIRLLSTREQQR